MRTANELINLSESIDQEYASLLMREIQNLIDHKNMIFNISEMQYDIYEAVKLIFEKIDVVKVLDVKDHGVYEVRKELWDQTYFGGPKDKPLEMTVAYSKEDNGYIGEPKMAKLLVEKYGMTKIMKSKKSHSVCSIGFCENVPQGIHKGKTGWAGWSHRAICVFTTGDKLFNEKEYGGMTEDTPFVKGGSVTIRNMDQAKEAAMNFAEYVS